jgi:hypothetical protein
VLPPRPPITNGELTQLIIGQNYIDVTFDTEQVDNTWIFLDCSVLNTTDPDPLNIAPGITTIKTSTGFRLYLNGMPDSNNYFLSWAISGVNIPPPVPHPATSYTLTGPSSGGISADSAAFTVALPAGGTVASPVTVTPSAGGGGGVFTPASVSLTTGSPSATFVYTPASYGAKTISTTNDGSLADPASVAFTCVATTYTLTGPSSGLVSVASTNFTVALPAGGVLLATVTVTPHESGIGTGGTFTPTTVNLTTGAPSATFTFTPGSSGTKTISATNNGGLTDPANLTYTVSAPVTPHLLNTLISYWKMDEATTMATRNDSNGTNHLVPNGVGLSSVAGLLGNAVYQNGGVGSPWMTCANNSTLQITGDCTFSFWARADVTTGGPYVILSKSTPTATQHDYILYYSSAGFVFQLGAGGSVTSVPTGAFSWYHVVAWYDSSDQKLRLRINDATTYVAATTTTPSTPNTEPIGVMALSGGQLTMNGVLDEFGFWKRVLTSQEITALYNAGAPLPYSSFTA